MHLKRTVRKVLFGSRPHISQVHAGLLRGLTLEVDTSIDTQQITGLYEREILEPVRRLASRARTALDIGAGDGYYTLYFASRPGIERIIACEPDSARISLLKRNLSYNPSHGVERVSVRALYVGGSGPASVDLESLLDGSPEPVLVKVDVEGAEMDVLESGRDSIARRETMLIVETHSLDLERECVVFLADLGYSCTIQKNGWYRKIVPELRHLSHNRWLVAERANRAVSYDVA